MPPGLLAPHLEDQFELQRIGEVDACPADTLGVSEDRLQVNPL